MRALDLAVEKRSRWMVFSLGLLIGFGGQAGGLYAAHTFVPEKTAKPDLVQMNLVKSPPKPKPEPPKPEPPKPEPPKPEPPKPEPPKPEPPKAKKKEPPKAKKKKRKKKKRKKKKKKKKKKQKQKPPQTEPPKPVKKAPLVTGITLGSTTAGQSGMTVQVGNTQMGEVGDTAVDPVTEPGSAPEPVEENVEPPAPPKVVVARIIKKTRVKPEYTPSARRQGIEGVIVVRLRINEKGSVTQVTVKSGLGYGLDEVTVEAVKQWRYRPKTVDGQPVKCQKTEKIEFMLND